MPDRPALQHGQQASFLRSVLQALVDPVFVLDYDGRYLDAFGASERGQYDSLQYLIGRTLHEVMAPPVADRFLADIRRVLDSGQLQLNEYSLAAEDCEGNPQDGPSGRQWFQGRIAPLQADGSGLRAVAWVVVNISERKRLEAELQRLADCDELTGLANRRAFLRRLDGRLDAPRDADAGLLQLALLDLDHFKRVNDRYGHLVGDEMLRHVACVLASGLDGVAQIGRIGGEEFAVMWERTPLDQAVSQLQSQRERLVREPLMLGGERIPVDFSAGLCSLLIEDRQASDLLRRADTLLYQAKDAGRGQVAFPGWRERRQRE